MRQKLRSSTQTLKFITIEKATDKLQFFDFEQLVLKAYTNDIVEQLDRVYGNWSYSVNLNEKYKHVYEVVYVELLRSIIEHGDEAKLRSAWADISQCSYN